MFIRECASIGLAGSVKGNGAQESARADLDALAAAFAPVRAQREIRACQYPLETGECSGTAIREAELAAEAQAAGEAARCLFEERVGVEGLLGFGVRRCRLSAIVTDEPCGAGP